MLSFVNILERRLMPTLARWAKERSGDSDDGRAANGVILRRAVRAARSSAPELTVRRSVGPPALCDNEVLWPSQVEALSAPSLLDALM